MREYLKRKQLKGFHVVQQEKIKDGKNASQHIKYR